MKASPWVLIRAHYATLRDDRTKKTRVQDHLLFEGVPALVLVACLVTQPHLPHTATAGLLTVAGIMSAFLFGVMLQVAERALFWEDEEPVPSGGTSRQAIFLEEIAANAGYAALISLLVAVLFVLTFITPGYVAVSIGLAVSVHLLLVLSMVLARVFALIQERLLRSRTGATITKLPERKAS